MQNTFIVEQKPLMAILSSMQPICTKRTTLDATSSIMFQVGHRELVLKSTDLEVSLQASYLLKESNLETVHTFLVSGKRIFDLVKELEGDINFSLEDNQLVVRSGTVNLALNIKNAEEFPPFPERIENLMHLDASFLIAMLNKVAFVIPQNNTNPALNGLLLELSSSQMTMTATDGHCLAQISSSKYLLEESRKWLLPRRAVFEVKKILEGCQEQTIFLGTCGNQLVFSGDSFNFFTKLLVDQFPHYSAILNKDGFVAATVDRSHLVKALRRSACLLTGQFIATKFDFAPERINMSMQNKEVGTLREEVPLGNYTGATLDIRFYSPYLLSGLQVLPEEKITFYLKSAARPIIFESETEESNFTYLVMPVSPTALSA
ncbi:DNA polymerase III subunit beta [Candidatus Dependentiae bacterium]|nr:DNA polymerase III subunit beta [Candidatus Dependentiae bacterium]